VQGYAPENSVQNQLFSHFGLRENPFGGTPDPRFLFHSETHREALASLINGIDCEFGFQVLVAQPGMGKTTLLFNFLERFRATAHTAFLFQPQLEPHELLQSLLFELGAGSEDTSVRKLSEQINQLLGRAVREHKRVIVVVDEAQNLDFPVLETLRQLSNFETPHAKLMQIVLAGQPQLAKNLAAPEQEQLRQRISTISRLSPLTLNETRAYINHRLRTAGYTGPDVFTLGAVRKIWESGKGVPRNINTLCFNAMLLGFAGHARSIDEIILQEAALDLDMPSVLADMYRMEPSLVISDRHGNSNDSERSKVQAIRARKPFETENANPGNARPENPAVLGGASPKSEINSAAAASGKGNISDGGENIPLALVEAIARISQALEEQKVLLAAKSGPMADAAGPTVSAPAAMPDKTAASSSKAPLSSQISQFTPVVPAANVAASTRSDSLVSGRRGSSHEPGKAVATGQRLATGVPAKSEKIGAAPNSLSAAPNVRSYHPGAKKSSEKGFWPKALALAVITCILTVVVVEKSPWEHLEPANAGEAGRADSAPSDSASGYSVPKGSPASPMDAPIRPSKSADSRGSRESGSEEFNDVTVRRFPTDSGITPGGATGQGPNSIFFDQDSAAIAGRYRLTLQQIAGALAKDPEMSAILEGHTDNSGPEAYNLDLSSRLATAVRNALINEFNVSSTQLTAIGSGSKAPVQPNSNALGRAYNRRVAVRFVRLGE